MARSPIILAIDGPLSGSCEAAARLPLQLDDIVSGAKVGVPFLLRCGVGSLAAMRSSYGGLIVADLKLADVGDVMLSTVSAVKDFVDAVIAHSFIGYSGALDELSEGLRGWGLKLVLVASMSHPGSQEVYDGSLGQLLKVISKARPWGVVAPATRPNVISAVRAALGSEVKVLSPGVGAQGARPGDALCAGADYEIVGRSITSGPDPRAAAEEVARQQAEALRVCRRGMA
jgi:orotidine-5'-phosphate decarboxylase